MSGTRTEHSVFYTNLSISLCVVAKCYEPKESVLLLRSNHPIPHVYKNISHTTYHCSLVNPMNNLYYDMKVMYEN